MSTREAMRISLLAGCPEWMNRAQFIAEVPLADAPRLLARVSSAYALAKEEADETLRLELQRAEIGLIVPYLTFVQVPWGPWDLRPDTLAAELVPVLARYVYLAAFAPAAAHTQMVQGRGPWAKQVEPVGWTS